MSTSEQLEVVVTVPRLLSEVARVLVDEGVQQTEALRIAARILALDAVRTERADPHYGHVGHSIAEPCIPQCPLYPGPDRGEIEAVLKIAGWIERDRREPDKILCHVQSLRRLDAVRAERASKLERLNEERRP